MSQNQPTRPVRGQEQPIRYGDVFAVSGSLAGEAISPRDAAMMQSAENRALGQTPQGGAASVMESAAMWNEQCGLVGHEQFSDTPGRQGVSVTQTDVPGCPGQRLVTEFVAGQAVGQYFFNTAAGGGADEAGGVAVVMWTDKVSIGEALEAAATTAGNKPVDASDAAAIQAAEATAAGANAVTPGGVAAAAQAAAAANALKYRDDEKTKLGDVVADASVWMAMDKEATREDAERVVVAEMRNNPEMRAHPGGVGASMVAAARLNQER
ncbi:late embryogenesis abundant protein D-34 [Musa acuminata AAA Group]|uniref:late embryogenesis abundant protein D-34 n=1 Tax=Musa acuminata AAA Group TaxID=214697 RepID=UPI0031E3E691